MSSKMFECTKCNYEARQYYKLISHYRFAHSSDRNFYLICNVDGCQKTYSLVDSFVKHLKRKHVSFYDSHLSRWRRDFREPEILQTLSEQIETTDECENAQINHEGHILNGEDREDYTIENVRKLAVFMMTLRERFGVTISALNFTMNEFFSMVSQHQAYQSKPLYSFLSEHGINDEHLLCDLKNLMRQRSEIEAACHTLDSEYKLEKYMRENFKFIPPEEFVLGNDDTGVQETYQYIPIIKTLQGLLDYDDVFSFVMNSHQSEGETLGDICDGELYRSNLFHVRNPTALQIILYYDDFTVTNPFGTKTKKYKLGAFYMLLGHLPPKHRSQLQTIQLVALCHAVHLKKYDFDSVLRPLLFDLKLLETEGFLIEKNDGLHRVFGSVLVIVADNLGAHGIGGFMESFNCLRNCRFCFCTNNEMHCLVECDKFHKRTVEMYNQQVENVRMDNSLSSVYGIKGSCCLNQLEHFYAVNGLLSDIAHDLFEGVLCDVMALTISHCVSSQFFSLDYLNKRIKEYPFLDTDKVNKPNTL